MLPRRRCPLHKVGQKLRPPPSQPLPVYKVALLALVFGFLVCRGVGLPVGCGLTPGRGAGLAVGVVSLLVRGGAGCGCGLTPLYDQHVLYL